MKGIVLAGGTGTRLFPITKVISKQLIPVYDKPMIYYPLSTLVLAGIRDILIITTPEDQPLFQRLLGNGSNIGLQFEYAIQEKPEGLAQAFLIAQNFLAGEPSCLILGDNIFYGHDLSALLNESAQLKSGAQIFAYNVSDPERYGVVEFDEKFKAVSLEEKPTLPKSHFAVPGIYFYDGTVSERVRRLKPSPRGELEITDLNRLYMNEGQLKVDIMKRGFAWLDTGTPDSLLEACTFIGTLERRQGLKVGCLEEICFRQGYMDKNKLLMVADSFGNGDYGQYLRKVAGETKLQ